MQAQKLKAKWQIKIQKSGNRRRPAATFDDLAVTCGDIAVTRDDMAVTCGDIAATGIFDRKVHF